MNKLQYPPYEKIKALNLSTEEYYFDIFRIVNIFGRITVNEDYEHKIYADIIQGGYLYDYKSFKFSKRGYNEAIKWMDTKYNQMLNELFNSNKEFAEWWEYD